MMALLFLFFGRTAALDSLPVAHPDSVSIVQQHLASKKTYELGLDGPFAYMSADEFKAKVLMAPQDCSATENRRGYVGDDFDPLPEFFDWRDAGIISEVKNQGHCGSCWTFSSTGALEGHSALHRGLWKRSLLSEQQLLDCAQAFDNHGCNGGLPSHAFEYINYAGGLAKEFAYPYEAREAACRFDVKTNKTAVGIRTMRSFNVTEGDEKSLMHFLVRRGPVSIAYQVVDDFRLYKSGVYTSNTCKQGPQDVNHAVLLVGYGNENGVPYWLVKNSWGESWGEEGYFKIERGKNMCGLATCASFPILEEPSSEIVDRELSTVNAFAE
jgi:cathepsin H